MRISAEPSPAFADVSIDIRNALDMKICPVFRFGGRPHIFHRIEFRRVPWKPFDHQPTLLGVEISLNFFCAMRGQAIPQQNDLAFHMPSQFFEKTNHFILVNRIFKNTQKQFGPAAGSAAGDDTDYRAFFPTAS